MEGSMAKRKHKHTRHGRLKKQMPALAAAIMAPEGAQPDIETNWSLVATNDNAPPEGMFVERRLGIRPTIDEIEREVAAGPVAYEGRTIRAIGKLRFSDGNQTEKAYAYGPDGKLLMYDATMPAGAMLGCSEKQERVLGGGQPTDGRNEHFRHHMPGRLPGKVARKERQQGSPISRDQARAELAAAYAATSVLPAVKRLPDGYPWKPSDLAELFMGCKVMPGAGGGGSESVADVSSGMETRNQWAEIKRRLGERDVAVVEAVRTARTLAEVAPGGHRRTAERRAMRYIEAANDNINAAIKKAA
jgi:hypothetical protein